MASQSRFRRPSVPGRFRLAAMAILLVPAGMLIALGLGEIAGGDWSGLQHVPEAAVLVGLVALAWWRARAAGLVLVVVSPLLLALWLTWTFIVREDEDPALVVAMVAVLLFLPPLLAGWLLLRSTATRR